MRTAREEMQPVMGPSGLLGAVPPVDTTFGARRWNQARLRLKRFMTVVARLCRVVSQRQRQAFLAAAKAQASSQGYTILEVNAGPIDLLLIKRQTRVVVMTRSREWLAGDHTQQVMDLMQADAAWVLDWDRRASFEGTGDSASNTLVKIVESASPVAHRTTLRQQSPLSHERAHPLLEH